MRGMVYAVKAIPSHEMFVKGTNLPLDVRFLRVYSPFGYTAASFVCTHLHRLRWGTHEAEYRRGLDTERVRGTYVGLQQWVTSRLMVVLVQFHHLSMDSQAHSWN